MTFYESIMCVLLEIKICSYKGPNAFFTTQQEISNKNSSFFDIYSAVEELNDYEFVRTEKMDETINKSITAFIKLIQDRYTNIETVYVFGSYARGTSTQDSDIDLALIFKHLDDSKRFDMQVQLMLLASQIDSRIEPHPISYDDFYSDNPFVVEIKKTGFEFLEKAI